MDWRESTGLNVYQMFTEHGGPGFWVRRLTWGQTCARVIAVGVIAGPAPYFGSPSVLMDVYSLDGQLKDELAPLPAAGTFKTWRRWPEPEWAVEVGLRLLEAPEIGEALRALDRKRHKLPGMQHARPTSIRSTRDIPEAERVYLQVPYSRKDEAKSIGAMWAAERKAWWLPAASADALADAMRRGFVIESGDC